MTGFELACWQIGARHIELNTKKSYLDEVKGNRKETADLALSAIHPDVGVLPGEDKVPFDVDHVRNCAKTGYSNRCHSFRRQV